MKSLYTPKSIPFWEEHEIEFRELFQARIVTVVKQTLLDMNRAWQFKRIEGPCLAPRTEISLAYSEDDVFLTNHESANDFLALRAETTPSSYAYARSLNTKLPLCVWQSGKSFRRELNDGASTAKMRFNEFHQLEFQCIYSDSTKADYRAALLDPIAAEISRFANQHVRIVDSDRLPAYSESTKDVEVLVNAGTTWREMASCSIRNDYSPDTRVAEIAIGLDRVVLASMKDS